MKNIILTALIVLFTLTTSQIKAQKIEKLDSITFQELDGLMGSKDYRNAVEINKYQTKAGNWINVGDTLVIGKPSNSNNIETSQSLGFRVANTNHSHIFLGTAGAMLMGTAMFGNETMTGDKVFITKMYIARLSKKNPFKVGIEFNKVGGGRFLAVKKLARAELEVALESGEIINGNRGMTREEAIAKLKEAKDLMDLEMMTQEEFNKLKEKLSPIIMGSN
jgi:hypothetical protein